MTPAALELHKKIHRLLVGVVRAYEELIKEWEKDFSR